MKKFLSLLLFSLLICGVKGDAAQAQKQSAFLVGGYSYCIDDEAVKCLENRHCGGGHYLVFNQDYTGEESAGSGFLSPFVWKQAEGKIIITYLGKPDFTKPSGDEYMARKKGAIVVVSAIGPGVLSFVAEKNGHYLKNAFFIHSSICP